MSLTCEHSRQLVEGVQIVMKSMERGGGILESIQLEMIANGIVIYFIDSAENSALHVVN